MNHLNPITPPKVKFLSSKEVQDASSDTAELVIASLEELSRKPEDLSSWSGLWDDSAKGLYQRRIKDSLPKKGDEKNKSKDPVSVTVTFANGCCTHFLFLPKKQSTFALHSELRKNFGPVFEKTETVRINLTRLSADLQTKTLHALLFLATTIRWKAVGFGKKAKKKDSDKKTWTLEVLSSLSQKENLEISEVALLQGRANNWVRTLTELPANELTPATYKRHLQDYCRKEKLHFQYFDQKTLGRMKAGAFLAVTRADPKAASGIACVTYKPKKKAKKKLVLVGKGLCYDTGGYNVKTGNYMFGMHGDMMGSAIAISLCGLFADLKVDFEVKAYLALAENLISPTAYKPNEVVVAMDGTSIEVIDTDAEGRMVLADTLALARKEKGSLCLDFATLTGAAVRSLDVRHNAIFSNDSKLAQLAVEAGEQSGERCWSFPIGSDYLEKLKSEVADLRQCGPGSNADHIYAATFLSQFIGEETPWVHCDLSSSECPGGVGLIGTQTTGMGVIWAYELVKKFL